MSLKSAWIKENISLILGAVLPVVLVILFTIAQNIGRQNIDPPQYDLLFSSDRYETNEIAKLRFRTNGGVLEAFVPSEKNYQMNQRLYRFVAASKAVKDVTPMIPVQERSRENEILLEIPADLKMLRLDTSYTAPDGYIFEPHSYDHRSGFFGAFLFSGNTEYGPRIRKDSSSISLKVDGRRYGNASFLGWIIPKAPGTE